MSTGYETLDVVDPWLVSVLGAALVPGLVTTIVVDQTSGDIALAYLLITLPSSRDIMGIGTIRIDTESIYQIKAVHQSNTYVPGRAAMRAVETALQGVSATTSAGNLICVRMSQFRYYETIDGMQFTHVGANYKIRAASN